MTKFEVYQSKDDNYRWRLKAANGEIVAVSEGYTTKYGAKISAQRVKEIAYTAIIVEI
jgi:uncharacterized protein